MRPGIWMVSFMHLAQKHTAVMGPGLTDPGMKTRTTQPLGSRCPTAGLKNPALQEHPRGKNVGGVQDKV